MYMYDYITVLGCKEMTPPKGAWMTRDGDVIEVGCHTGSKTWSLRCESNEWIGVLGQCGTSECHYRVLACCKRIIMARADCFVDATAIYTIRTVSD